MLYNVLTFLNYAIIHSKCASSKECTDFAKQNENWEKVKMFNSVFFGIAISYILFRTQCPRQKFGMPSKKVCRRILCQNNIHNESEYKKFTERQARKKKEADGDELKYIESMGLRSEDGKTIKNSRPDLFQQSMDNLSMCIDGARSEVEAMGFTKDSYLVDCTGFTGAEKRYKDEKKKIKEKEEDDRLRKKYKRRKYREDALKDLKRRLSKKA